ncbi:MAG: hypothetical protein EHM20_05420, partial [Alphaproteobacteria bacterium]
MSLPASGPFTVSDVKDTVYIREKNYFLDKLSTYTKNNCGGAWSVRLTNSSYSGPALTVSRGSDNEVLDFYPDINGKLGTNFRARGTSLSAWLAGSTGYVTKLYDQSGNQRHLLPTDPDIPPTIGPVSVLDTISPDSKTAARGVYTLFRASTTYTGPTIRLRRSSDNAVLDFYADVAGNLGTEVNGTGTSLTAWRGTSDTLYTVTWYDQSSQGNHATQATTTLQPTFNTKLRCIDFGTPVNAFLVMPSGTVPVEILDAPYSFVFRHGKISNTDNGTFVSGGAAA